jgi:hypothetical protein
MQHMPCSPDSRTRHKKKETEHAAHALQPRQQDTPQEEGNRTCSTLFLHRKPISVLQIRKIMPQRKAIYSLFIISLRFRLYFFSPSWWFNDALSIETIKCRVINDRGTVGGIKIGRRIRSTGRKPSTRHFVHHKSYKIRCGTENSPPPWWEGRGFKEWAIAPPDSFIKTNQISNFHNFEFNCQIIRTSFCI